MAVKARSIRNRCLCVKPVRNSTTHSTVRQRTYRSSPAPRPSGACSRRSTRCPMLRCPGSTPPRRSPAFLREGLWRVRVGVGVSVGRERRRPDRAAAVIEVGSTGCGDRRERTSRLSTKIPLTSSSPSSSTSIARSGWSSERWPPLDRRHAAVQEARDSAGLPEYAHDACALVCADPAARRCSACMACGVEKCVRFLSSNALGFA